MTYQVEKDGLPIDEFNEYGAAVTRYLKEIAPALQLERHEIDNAVTFALVKVSGAERRVIGIATVFE